MDYYIASWNVENLFDIQDSPRRSDKLQRTLQNELDGWSQPVLDQKIAQLASVISRMNGGNGPDVLALCEIENRHVLDLLIAALSGTRTYEAAHHDMSDDRGIDVGFLYDRNLTQEALFSHFIIKRTATRELLQVNFRTASNRLLVLIGNHWPSRSGGQLESEPGRIIAGETLAYFHKRIREEHGADTAIIAMGDFNDEPADRSVAMHAASERERVRATNATSVMFLNLMWPLLGQSLGSFYFDNWPLLLDQFMVSRGILKGTSGFSLPPNTGPQIVRFPDMINLGLYPVPRKFGRGQQPDTQGFSDHFPIRMTLHEA